MDLPNTQIILTTRSANIIVKELNYEHLRVIIVSNEAKTILQVLPGQLPYPSLN